MLKVVTLGDGTLFRITLEVLKMSFRFLFLGCFQSPYNPKSQSRAARVG